MLISLQFALKYELEYFAADDDLGGDLISTIYPHVVKLAHYPRMNIHTEMVADHYSDIDHRRVYMILRQGFTGLLKLESFIVSGIKAFEFRLNRAVYVRKIAKTHWRNSQIKCRFYLHKIPREDIYRRVIKSRWDKF